MIAFYPINICSYMMENLSELDHSAIDNDFFSNMSTAKAVLAIPKFLPKLESAIESARSFSRREIFLSDN